MENFSNHSIDINSLPNFEEVEFRSISSKYLIKSNIQTTIFLVIVLAGWAVFFYYQASMTNLIYGMIAIFLFFSFRFWNNYMVQKTYGYALREKDILFKRGFFVNTTTIVPFNRIQHVSVSRDAVDKLLNISSVQVFTAGGSGSDINIPGLQPDLAVKLKEGLANKLTTNGGE